MDSKIADALALLFGTGQVAVFFGSVDDSKIYAVNTKTGQQIWNYTTGDEITSSPAIADGVLFIGSFDNNVYALNISGGNPLIPKTNPNSNHSTTNPGSTKSGSLPLTVFCAMAIALTIIVKKRF